MLIEKILSLRGRRDWGYNFVGFQIPLQFKLAQTFIV